VLDRFRGQTSLPSIDDNNGPTYLENSVLKYLWSAHHCRHVS